MPNRADVVKSALSFIGTKWKHQGRDREGCDCVGLVAAVATDLGILPEDFEVPPYRREPGPELLGYFDRYMKRIMPGQIQDGTVVIFSYIGTPYHAGIVVNASAQAMVHAFATQRKVVTDYLDNSAKGRKLIRAYDYRGLADG